MVRRTDQTLTIRTIAARLTINGRYRPYFRIRIQQNAREQRDRAVEALRGKYAPKIAALQEKVRKAQQAMDREAAQAQQVEMQTVISVGATLLGAFMGRKVASTANIGKATTAIRGIGRSAQQQSDVGRAKDTLATYQKQLDDLNDQFQQESTALESKIDPATEALETVIIKLKKTDISVQLVSLVWAPYAQDAHGQPAPTW